MSAATRIEKFKLCQTPLRVAVQNIELWQDAVFHAEEDLSAIENSAKLLGAQQAKMVQEIRGRYIEKFRELTGPRRTLLDFAKKIIGDEAHKTIKQALHDVNFINSLYAHALSGLLRQLLAAFQLIAFSVSGPLRNPGLFPYLTEAHNALSRHIAIVNLIEETYLKSPVLPPWIRQYTEHLQDACRWLRKSCGAKLPQSDLYNPKDWAGKAIETVDAAADRFSDPKLCFLSWNAAFGTLKTTFAQLQYVTEVSNITVMSHMDALPRELKKRMSIFASNNFDKIDASMEEVSRKVEAQDDRDSRGNKSRPKPATRKRKAAA